MTIDSFRHAHVATSLGELTLVACADELTGVYFPEHRPAPAPTALGTRVDRAAGDPVLGPAAHQITEFLAGERTDFDLPIALHGNPFQQLVWAELRALTFGTSITYGELAARIGRPGAARAVGSAVGRNPVSIVVGCHRVLGANGRITGYAGGVERKRALLALEGAIAI